MPKVTDFNQTPNFSELEVAVQTYWQETQAFEKSVAQRPADQAYVFYDGPPFATGLPHYGHLLASTTKDLIPRYWTMKGYRVERVWGWDCHGLPIENMIEKKLGIKGGKKGIEALGIDKFNEACRNEVLRLDQEWERIIGRLGRWVDFKNNYKTMDKNFMESVWWGFKQLVDKDLVYEGKKVILYCSRCATPLSNFEIAMDNSYQEVTESGTTYKYPVTGQPDTYILAWSTTPWNKLATPALAVHPNLTYVKVKQGEEYYYLAESRLEHLKPEPAVEVVEKLTGAELSKLTYALHYDFYPERSPQDRAGVIVADEFVTAEDGTGVVTLAIYGEDDFRVMQAHQVQLVEHVDDQGKLKPEVKPWAWYIRS
jgi:isoleucyl-tRNA synthetase